MFNPYTAINCAPHLHQLAALFIDLSNAVRPAAFAALVGTQSPAFTAFFKEAATAKVVGTMLFDIFNGTELPPIPGREVAPAMPRFVCATMTAPVTWKYKDQRTSEAYETCQNTYTAGNAAYPIFGSDLIVLCPQFFTAYPAQPTKSTSNCIKLNTAPTMLQSTGVQITRYQIWIVLHQLAQWYLYAKFGTMEDLKNVYNCLSLEPDMAIKNAQSYVYYVASKSLTF